MQYNFVKITANFPGMWNYYEKSGIDADSKILLTYCFQNLEEGSLKSNDDYDCFLRLLNKLRTTEEIFIGRKRRDLINRLLTQGKEGIYTASHRFMYELIQNVDDCTYLNAEDQVLDIAFDYNKGLIILDYNESGFTPRDVFSITNEGDSAKIISEKECIGEKGIGFKSVFGLAQKVLIQSNRFEFILEKERSTIPKFNDIITEKPPKTTRLTLFVEEKTCRETFSNFIELYSDRGAILKENPIVFLNKLKRLTIKDSEGAIIQFTSHLVKQMQSPNFDCCDIIQLESHIKSQNVDFEDNPPMSCYRYSRKITYNHEQCLSKFGEQDCPDEKQFDLVALFPTDPTVLKTRNEITNKMMPAKGMMYCFLPTRMELEVPLILNVPYELNTSREYVNPNLTHTNPSAWFNHTTEELSKFLIDCYLDARNNLKQNIIYFFPQNNTWLFKYIKDNSEYLREKDNRRLLHGDIIRNLDLLLCEDSLFHNVNSVICLEKEYTDPHEIIEHISDKTSLFKFPDKDLPVSNYGISQLRGIPDKVYEYAVDNPEAFNKCVKWLEKNDLDHNDYRMKDNGELSITDEHINIACEHPWLFNYLSKSIFNYTLQNQSLLSTILPHLRVDDDHILIYKRSIISSTTEMSPDMFDAIISEKDKIEITSLFKENIFIYGFNNLHEFGKAVKWIEENNLINIDFEKIKSKITNLNDSHVDIILDNHDWLFKAFAQRLFDISLTSDTSFVKIIPHLKPEGLSIEFNKSIKNHAPVSFNTSMIRLVTQEEYQWLLKKFNDVSFSYIRKIRDCPKSAAIHLTDEFETVPEEFTSKLKTSVPESSIDKRFKEFLVNEIKYKLYTLGIPDRSYIIADKGILLSNNPDLCFAELCVVVDPNKTMIMQLANDGVTKALDSADENSPEYFDIVHAQRWAQFDGLRKNGLASRLIQIINDAGKNDSRLLSELIQNADDLKYNVETPEFTVSLNHKIMITHSNEEGFTGKDLRAITSIGESTKHRIKGEETKTGEKGVGFKTVFKKADKVSIYSGSFNFSLSNENPLVPERIPPLEEQSIGTTMVFELKDNEDTAINALYKTDFIRKICLCLKKLKRLQIFDNIITVEDDDNDSERTIRFFKEGKRESYFTYNFKKHTLHFDVMDEKLLQERYPHTINADPHHTITCYIVPQNLMGSFERNVYSTFPTDIRISENVPIIVDAPFQLTTDRSGILENQWNEMIRSKVYDLLESVLIKLFHNNISMLNYVAANDYNKFVIFNDNFLNSGHDWIPFFKTNIHLLKYGTESPVPLGESNIIIPSFIHSIAEHTKIDVNSLFGQNVLLDIDERSIYWDKLCILGCMSADSGHINEYLKKICKDEIFNEPSYGSEVLDDVYRFLKKDVDKFSPSESDIRLPVIPKKIEGGIHFITNPGDIFYSEDSQRISDDNFIVVDTSILSVDCSHDIFGNRLRFKELRPDDDYKIYLDNLLDFIQRNRNTPEIVCKKLMTEIEQNMNQLSRSRLELQDLLEKGVIKLKTCSDDCYSSIVFIADDDFYPSGELLNKFIIDDDFSELSTIFKLRNIYTISSDDLPGIKTPLTDDDVLDLIQDSFSNSASLIQYFLKLGLVSSEQLERLDVYPSISPFESICHNPIELHDEESFPGKSVSSPERIRDHLSEDFRNSNPWVRRLTYTVEPSRSIDLRYLDVYQSVQNPNYSFCQMCQRKLSNEFFEKVMIESLPKYAWKQCYLNLCLICSKRYKSIRSRNIDSFLKKIINADYRKSNVIPIDLNDNETILFSSTHLFELQEIYKQFNPLDPSNHRARNDKSLPIINSIEIYSDLKDIIKERQPISSESIHPIDTPTECATDVDASITDVSMFCQHQPNKDCEQNNKQISTDTPGKPTEQILDGSTLETIPSLTNTPNDIKCNIPVDKIAKYSTDKTTLISVQDTESFIIPNEVTCIGSRAFESCISLKEVQIPSSVKTIKGGAFQNCKSLKEISIPNSVKRIQESTFLGCISLENVTIPDSVTSIGGSAFEDCEMLNNVIIPSSVSTIGDRAFKNCKSLTIIDISRQVGCIEPYTFDGCSSLQEITIPNLVTKIGNLAFRNCSSLVKVEIPDSMRTIGFNAFVGCKRLQAVEIPKSIQYLGNAFDKNVCIIRR